MNVAASLQPSDHGTGRTVLLAGATGLVGHALLPLLRASPHVARVHVLARRIPHGAATDSRTSWHFVDFAHLPELPALADAYIALGTTIKAAGSQAAFRAVDLDAVVATARAARAAGATRLAVISALGADSRSTVFYNRVKGDMQSAVGSMGFDSVVVAQPSLLLGDRTAIGQPVRAAEAWAERLAPALWLVPRGVRPIAATRVASAMVAAMTDAAPGVRVLASAEMQA